MLLPSEKPRKSHEQFPQTRGYCTLGPGAPGRPSSPGSPWKQRRKKPQASFWHREHQIGINKPETAQRVDHKAFAAPAFPREGYVRLFHLSQAGQGCRLSQVNRGGPRRQEERRVGEMPGKKTFQLLPRKATLAGSGSERTRGISNGGGGGHLSNYQVSTSNHHP